MTGFMLENHGRYTREDSSASDDGGDSQSNIFIIGSDQYPSATTLCTSTSVITVSTVPMSSSMNTLSTQAINNTAVTSNTNNNHSNLTSAHSANSILMPQSSFERLVFSSVNCAYNDFNKNQ